MVTMLQHIQDEIIATEKEQIMTDIVDCPECGGSGHVAVMVTISVCCGRFNRDGSCCGMAEPGQDWDYDACGMCCGSGQIPAAPESNKQTS
jgi:RecJ-like exonuclease